MFKKMYAWRFLQRILPRFDRNSPEDLDCVVITFAVKTRQ